MTTRFSPRPLADYGFSANSGIFNMDPDAWNLAYLSWDFEHKQAWPDPEFSSHVRRTLQFVISNGVVDLTNTVPEHLTVRGYLAGPPPQVAYRILNLPRIRELPMYKAYGQYWAETVQERAKAWRDHTFEDVAPKQFSEALKVISEVK